MSDVNEQIVERFGTDILTQDNRITADPIFCVQQRERIYGMDPQYGGDNFKWVYVADAEYGPTDEELAQLNELAETWDDTVVVKNEDGDDVAFEKVFYVDYWRHVQSFFLERHAQRFIDENAHNLGDTRIYVDSAYRNTEWQFLRDLLIQAAEAAVDAG